MSKSVQISAATIQHDLLQSETEIDLAISRSATLLASMTTARVETASPFATGQVAIMRLVRAIGSLSDARSNIARVHADLLQVAEVRADYVSIDECPSGLAQTKVASIRLAA